MAWAAAAFFCAFFNFRGKWGLFFLTSFAGFIDFLGAGAGSATPAIAAILPAALPMAFAALVKASSFGSGVLLFLLALGFCSSAMLSSITA